MAPYKSDAQRKWFHTEAAKKQEITKEMISEYDKASKGLKLPEYKRKDKFKKLKKLISKG